ncbi:MAG: SpvB/TcaC N-terminal domain-containing protein [Bacteroidota bacterium]
MDSFFGRNRNEQNENGANGRPGSNQQPSGATVGDEQQAGNQENGASNQQQGTSQASTSLFEGIAFDFNQVQPQVPGINLPKGGGAITGMGEKYEVNPVTGTGSMSIPIKTSPGRGGFGPQLALAYDSGSGNSPYGIGWNLTYPAITRKTQKGLPKYQDAEESDTFIMAGAEDLVPFLEESSGAWVRKVYNKDGYKVHAYRPRTEGLFARIERRLDENTGISHWQVTTRDNVTTVYGKEVQARISDPNDSTRVFQWLIEKTYDDKGNIVVYEYKQENNENIPPSIYEKHRLTDGNAFAQKYLKKVRYGNSLMVDRLTGELSMGNEWHFELIFDYGEHTGTTPSYAETQPWLSRQDPFSHYRAGFEIRTYRLCRRMLMFHNFTELGANPYLVASTDVAYDENATATRLISAQYTAYQEGEAPQQLPPVTFTYTEAKTSDQVRYFDIEDLKDLPGGITGPQLRWTDLYGEGLQGILYEDNGGWWYKKNRGDGGYYAAEPAVTNQVTFDAFQPVSNRPSLANLQGLQQQLTDVDGDGQLDLVVQSTALQGVFSLRADGQWETFTPYEHQPNVNWQDPNLRMIDLTGDGFADIVITEDYCFTWYESKAKKGYVPSMQVAQALEEENGPALVFADREQSIYLADMSGGGMTEIVRVRNGEVCFWPNLGYGRFGKKVILANSPWFDHDELFEQDRVRLADVDGSGTTDIIYIAKDEIKCWPNQSGNMLAAPVTINAQFPVDNLSAIAVFDLLGKGTSCIVCSSPLPGEDPGRIRYIDLMDEGKPYLLTQTNNNMGAITNVTYAPSTKFYLQDERTGKPWVTKLPFPVQVVEKTEMVDQVQNNRFAARYAYHHGYFDGVEREFRGFGMVEQWDTEDYALFAAGGSSNVPEEPFYVPPVHTKTWFHTGFYREKDTILKQYAKEYYQGDAQAWDLPDVLLPAGLTAEEEREAARALRGQVLRSEVYADDYLPESVHPYTVAESNYSLRQIQPRVNNLYGVYLVTPSESLSHQYERVPDDPRTQHQLVLETDAYGQVIEAANVAYPRRIPQHPEQGVLLVAYAETDLINLPDAADFYRLGLPRGAKQYEITGLTMAGKFEIEALKSAIVGASTIPYEAQPTPGQVEKRAIGVGRISYYNEDLSAVLPEGQVAFHALPYQTHQLALTPGLINNVLNNGFTRVDAAVLSEGGYQDLLSDGHYWIPSGKVVFDAAHFYLPVVQEDPFGNQGTVTYDAYHLLVNQAQDALGNVIQAQQDYRLLQPDLMTDPNLNRQAVAFDVLGMVTAVAVMGKEGSTDGDTLADPSATFAYDLFRWMNEQRPNYAYSRTRETHKDANTHWLEGYEYSDGLGNVVMAKALAAPGDAFLRDAQGTLQRDGNGDLVTGAVDPRWIGNGRTVLDNKGNPIKQYEPYYSSTFEYEDEAELVEYGVTPVIHYDPLNRAIKTDLPDGTFTKVIFDPWQQASYDQNDTVLESDWYSQRNSPDPTGVEPTDAHERAAWLAAKHADIPQITVTDTLGRPFLIIDDNADHGLYEMKTLFDVQGNPTAIIDAKGRQSFTYRYGALGQLLYTDHIDNGARYAMADVVGNPLRIWDNRSHQMRFAYDALLRPTRTYLVENYDQVTPDPEKLISLTVFGEEAPAPENKNVRGQAYISFDSAGMSKNVRFDFKGNPLKMERTMALQYQTVPDWIALDSYTNTTNLESSASALLENETFESEYLYDALNRVRKMTTPDDSHISPSYDEGGALERLWVRLIYDTGGSNMVQSILYNARGQRTRITYDNGSQTTYSYDPDTFRLAQLRTTRDGGSTVLQELSYVYDPVGNIVAMRDDAQQTVFFNNAQVAPHTKYTYDALHRLLSANGREMAGSNTTPGPNDLAIQPLPDNNTAALRTYNQSYEYDEMGNIMKMIHLANGGNWTRHYHYDINNYLLSTSNDGIAPTQAEYAYDIHGNMTQMPHLSTMTWDHADRLQSANLGGGGTAYYCYDGGGDRARKVIENGNIKEERLYLGGWEVYRKYNNGALETERESFHVMDDASRIALLETLKVDNSTTLATSIITKRYQLSNHLDSANLELDENAAIISYEEYYPFGTSSYRSGRNNAETSLKRYRYVGKERDDETGLYYYGARYYAAWLARFVSVDPLKDDYPQLNSYNYAGNKPITFRDIDGRQSDGADENRRKKIEEFNKWQETERREEEIRVIFDQLSQSKFGGAFLGEGVQLFGSIEEIQRRFKIDFSQSREEIISSVRRKYRRRGIRSLEPFGSNKIAIYQLNEDNSLRAAIFFPIPEEQKITENMSEPVIPKVKEATPRTVLLARVLREFPILPPYELISGEDWNLFEKVVYDLTITSVSVFPFAPVALNPFYKAEAIAGDVGGIFGGLGIEADIGGYFVLAGEHEGEFLPYHEIATGVMPEVSVAGELARVDFTGPTTEFGLKHLYGEREKLMASGNVYGADLGGGVAWSTVGNYYVYTYSVSIGVGASAPVTGGYNSGEIKRLE